MASLNQVQLIGRLGKDPEIRSLNSGDRVANFSIATEESWKDKQSGERKKKTEWVNCVVWGGLVDIVERYTKKGSQVFLQGKLQTRKWQDRASGQDRYATEVVLQGFSAVLQLLDPPSGDRGGGGGGGDYGSQSGAGYSGGGSGGGYEARPKESFPADLDDEIPFLRAFSIW